MAHKKQQLFLTLSLLFFLVSLAFACSAVSEDPTEEEPEPEEDGGEDPPIPNGPRVRLPKPYGVLEGKIKETVGYSGRDKKKYEVYRSIPYAVPISGENRFGQSEPLPSDYTPLGDEISPFDASKTGPLCPQGEMNPDDMNVFMEMSVTEVIQYVIDHFQQRTRKNVPVSDLDVIALIEKAFNIEELNIRNKTLSETIKAWLDVDFGMSEDCLHLTVSTPNKTLPEGSKGFPVMFFVHGGGFSSGTHLHSEADRLGDVADVVVVSINYRVGILGFLCLDSDESAGNQGMLDILLALEWVQKYIHHFGGDKDRVTIFGESAGSATIGHLLLSPATRDKKLFKYGIGQSGSAISPWAFDRNPRKSAYEFVERMNCTIDQGDDAIVQCLRKFEAWELAKEFNKLTSDRRKHMDLGFGGTSPCAQTKGKRVFYGPNHDPQELLHNGKYNTEVPIFFGANLYEGIYAYNLVYNTFIVPNQYNESNAKAKKYLKYQFLEDINKSFGFDGSYTLTNIIKKNYFGEKTDMGNLKAITPGLVDYIGMHLLKASSYEMMSRHVANDGKAFWYSFEYAGNKSICHILAMLSEAPDVGPYGTCHGDELLFMFDYELPIVTCEIQGLLGAALQYLADCQFDFECTVTKLRVGHYECLDGTLTDKEKKVSETIVKAWTNFATHGDPNGEGIPVIKPWNPNEEPYLVIDLESKIDNAYQNKYITTKRNP